MKKTYMIDYCCASVMGFVRKNNEDNYYCDGRIRLDPDSTDDELFFGSVKSSDNQTFAVFDGMGGEACGEIASFVAAQNTADFVKDRLSYDEYLYELSEILNDKVREETKSRFLVLMGATAAMVQFSDDQIYVLNAGDSKVYRLSKHRLDVVSNDHVAYGYGRKAPLTKFLGMPGEDTKLEPYIARGDYKSGDVFLLCTDGVSDMLSDEELLRIADNSKKSVKDITTEIISKVNAAGAMDNATIILCRVTRPSARK